MLLEVLDHKEEIHFKIPNKFSSRHPQPTVLIRYLKFSVL